MRLYDPDVQPILGFSGQYRFLSNFYPIDFIVDGQLYMSSEHFYMSCKTDDENVREKIIACKTPAEAKRLGRSIKLRPDWDEKHRNRAMMTALTHKFKDPEMKKLLGETGFAYLEETNHWNDIYWGVCNGQGRNMLGRMLMFIRSNY